jgi:hypothetical protein
MLLSDVKILKSVKVSKCPFTANFRGFDKIEVVRGLFGDETAKILAALEVEFTDETIYMRVSNSDGRLMINPNYFLAAEFTEIYLDVIHELVHVRQFLEGKRSNSQTAYVERPLEIEAYNIMVEEAKTIGVSENEIMDYLNSELLDNEELKQLAETLGIEYLA